MGRAEGEKERLVSKVPMTLNGKTPDTGGTNNSGFANAKEKMLSSYAPPPHPPPPRHRISGKALFP